MRHAPVSTQQQQSSFYYLSQMLPLLLLSNAASAAMVKLPALAAGYTKNGTHCSGVRQYVDNTAVVRCSRVQQTDCLACLRAQQSPTTVPPTCTKKSASSSPSLRNTLMAAAAAHKRVSALPPPGTPRNNGQRLFRLWQEEEKVGVKLTA